MSAITNLHELISVPDYLEGERYSEVRHEYLDGYVYAIAGASDEHNRIAGNIFAELREKLRGGACEAFVNDMKVKIPPAFANAFYYPDVLVACDPTDNARYYRQRPSVIFEVISPETERTDRREKAVAYRQLASLEVYVLVEQNAAALTVLRRVEVLWQPEQLKGLESVLILPNLGVEIPLDRIYERTAVARPN